MPISSEQCNKISVLLPTRVGSQRIKNKNTRKFANAEGGLLGIKLRQLLDCRTINNVVLSTNDSECIKICESIDPDQEKLTIDHRPDELCRDDTPLTDFIEYVPEIIEEDHILWTHVTTPFISGKIYDKVIEKYLEIIEKGYDSLVSVHEFKNFVFNHNKKLINGELLNGKWPRTQDLNSLYEINHGVFLAPRDIYVSKRDRIGINPYLYTMDKISSFDIDWEEDFKIAEKIYELKR